MASSSSPATVLGSTASDETGGGGKKSLEPQVPQQIPFQVRMNKLCSFVCMAVLKGTCCPRVNWDLLLCHAKCTKGAAVRQGLRSLCT